MSIENTYQKIETSNEELKKDFKLKIGNILTLLNKKFIYHFKTFK